MAITKADIKLLASQELSDNDSGGGAMTGNEIVDGNVNNLFPDISRLDRTIGRVSLRKAFAAVQTANTDVYYGSHAILTDPPDDSSISVTMFSTNDYFDRRTDAKDHMESYVVRSVLTRMRVYDNQLAGQKTVLLIQKPGLTIPEIGEVFCLVEDEGSPTEFEQFVKVTAVDVDRQTFSAQTGNYDLDVITVSISDALRYTFHGGEPDPYDTAAQTGDQAVFRRTSVADASQYFGVSKLAQAITTGDLSFNINSIYAHIVPSAQSEAPLADLSPSGDAIRLVSSSENEITLSNPAVVYPGGKYYAGRGITRGTLILTDVYWSTSWADNGDGTMTRVSGTYDANPTVESYEDGVIDLDGITSHAMTASFIPATAITDIADTEEIEVSISNRALTYVKTLNPAPAPGSLTIDYMALGKWYRLRDQGDGSATGDGNYGVASINYATGTVTITLAALPDVDTSILFTWGGKQHYTIQVGNVNIPNPGISHTTDAGTVLPGSLTVTYTSGSTQYTLTDNSLGQLSGTGGSGVVDYVNGFIYFTPSHTPDPTSNVIYDYESGAIVTENFLPAESGGYVTMTLASSTIVPGSVNVKFTTRVTGTRYLVGEVISHGYGNVAGTRTQGIIAIGSLNTDLHYSEFDDGAGGFETTNGSINYGSGAINIQVENFSTLQAADFDPGPSDRDWQYNNVTETFISGQTVVVTYFETGVSGSVEQDVIPAGNFVIELMPYSTQKIVEGSVSFTLNGVAYFDRNGTLLRDHDPSTNAGTPAGSMDYLAGVATLTDWDAGDNAITIQSLLSQNGSWSMYDIRFRTAGAPLQPASFYIQGTAVSDSTLISGTSDLNGDISTADIEGHINIENGIARMKFGRWVTAAGNEGEDWYDPLELDGGGQVWQPEPIDPSTLSYNAVAYTYIPIDADLIGVDPVRLPSDGRVPIFRPGGVVVIHNTTSEACPDNLVADQVVNLTGGPWSLIELYDQDGLQVDPTLYTVDLDAATVTMGNPLDLSGYNEPLVAMKRIEDMKLISDVQINGDISVANAITHDYPANTSYVSSALIFSDMGSRYFNFFSQQTWTGEWDDAVIGDTTTAQYNEVLYPVQIRNDGAIEERWALIFTSSTVFNIVGETVGVIGQGATDGAPGSVISPTNPQTGAPYFTIETDGFGSGWSTGNVIRFNTESANFPIWLARTTLPGPEEEPNDQFTLQIRGDAD